MFYNLFIGMTYIISTNHWLYNKTLILRSQKVIELINKVVHYY